MALIADMTPEEIKGALANVGWQALDRVLKDVQSRFTYVPDIERWKLMDYWIGSKSPGVDFEGQVSGDCDDHALMCRYALNKLNIPNRLVFLIIPAMQSAHLVCECKGWILDNRYPMLNRKEDLNQDYTWVSISGYKEGEEWHAITN